MSFFIGISILKFFDSAFITVQSQVGLPATILLSYASPFENTAKLILSDGIIELINGLIN